MSLKRQISTKRKDVKDFDGFVFIFQISWFWLLHELLWQKIQIELKKEIIMAAKEVSPQFLFIFEFLYSFVTIDLTFLCYWGKSIAFEFWFVECFFVNTVREPQRWPFLIVSLKEALGSCNADFGSIPSQNCISNLSLTSSKDLTMKTVLAKARVLAIASANLSCTAESKSTLTTTIQIVLQVPISDRWPGLGQDEGLLRLARQDWYATRPHQEANHEGCYALRILFRHTRLRLDSRIRSQALWRV